MYKMRREGRVDWEVGSAAVFYGCLNRLAKAVNLTYYLQKVIFGAPDGPYPPDGAGATGGHLGGGASIRSSPDGQDEAIDTHNHPPTCPISPDLSCVTSF